MKKHILSLFLITSLVFPLKATNVELGDPALSSDSETPSTLAVSLKNPAVTIVGMQFDIVYSSGLASPGIPTLPEGTNHEMDVRLVEEGRYRVMVFSRTNQALVAPYSVNLRFGFAEAAPDGGPAMRLENLVLAASDGSEIPAASTYGPIGGWRNENFSDDVWNSKTTGGDSGDADKDGLANIQEFYFNTDPKSSDSNVTSVVQGALASDGSGGKVLRLTWTGRKAVDGVKAVVYGGTDPANLTEVVSEQVVDGSDSEVDKLKAEKDVKDAKAYFMEIRVERE
ncbi:MAG: hypothetical protein NTZ94_01785 [Verrucomicrobia bacterium]|nr:hypothetical protein [Verrucomicrobiota bacterium]